MAQGEEFDGPDMYDVGISPEALGQSVSNAAAAGVASAMRGVIDPMNIIGEDVRAIVELMKNSDGTFEIAPSGVTGGAIAVGFTKEEVTDPIVQAIEGLSKEITVSDQRREARVSRQRDEDRQARRQEQSERRQDNQELIKQQANIIMSKMGIDAQKVADEQQKQEDNDKAVKMAQKGKELAERQVQVLESIEYLLSKGTIAESVIREQMTSDQILAEAKKQGYTYTGRDLTLYDPEKARSVVAADTIDGIREIIGQSKGGRGGSSGASSSAVGGLQNTVSDFLGTINSETGDVEGGKLTKYGQTLENIGNTLGDYAASGAEGAGAAGKVAGLFSGLGGTVGKVAGTAAKFLPGIGLALTAGQLLGIGVDQYRQYNRTANEQGIDFGQYVQGSLTENRAIDSFLTGIDEKQFEAVQQGLVSGGVKLGSEEHKQGYDFARGAMADYGISAQNAAQYYTNMIKAGRSMDDLAESMDALKSATQGTALSMTDVQAMVGRMGSDFSKALGGNEALSQTAAFDIMQATGGVEGTGGEFFTNLVNTTDFKNPAMDKQVRELIDKGTPIGLAYAQVAKENPEYSSNSFIWRPLSSAGKNVMDYINDKDAAGLAQAFRDSGSIGISVQDILKFATDFGVPEKVIKELDWDSLAEYLCGDVAETGENIENQAEGEVKANVQSSNQKQESKESSSNNTGAATWLSSGTNNNANNNTTNTTTKTARSAGVTGSGVEAASYSSGTAIKGLVSAGVLTKEQAASLGAMGGERVMNELEYRYSLSDTGSSLNDWLKSDEGKQAYADISSNSGADNSVTTGNGVTVTIGFADNAQAALYAMVENEEDRLSRNSGVQ